MSGVADLMRDHGEETRFRAARRLGLVAGLGERALRLDAAGHIAADALYLGSALRTAAHDHVAPGDPARAVGRHDLLVVQARSIRQRCGLALRQQRRTERAAEQRVAGAREQRAIGIVHVGDAAVAAAAHDQVALRFEKTRGALLGLLELPVAIAKILDALASLAQLRVQRNDARDQKADRPACRAEQGGCADREQVRIVMHAGIAHGGEEAEGRRERHRQQHDRAHDKSHGLAAERHPSGKVGARGPHV